MEQRMKRVVSVLVGIVALAALAGAACGGDDDDDNGDLASPTSEATTAAVPTPFPTPMVNGNEIVSEAKGYAVTMPDGWKPRFNLIQTSDASADAYFEELRPGAAVQANIAVTCILEKTLPQDQRAEVEQTVVARLGLNRDISVSTVQIGGQEATAIRYVTTSQQNPDQPELDKVDIIFGSDKCDYKVTTTVLDGERDQYQPIFDAFIASFRLLE
jgi:hypothetical protein